MIAVCGNAFGDNDYCDLYSPLYEVPEGGKKIKPEHREDYRKIIQELGRTLVQLR